MKKFFRRLQIASLLLLFAVNSFAQTTKPFHITGQLKNIEAKKVYLVRFGEGSQQFDSANVVNGSYELRGEMGESNVAVLVNGKPFGSPKEKNIAQIWLTPGNLAIIHTDSFSNTGFLGSPVNEQFKKQFHDNIIPYMNRVKALSSKLQAARQDGDETAVNATTEELKNVKKEEWENLLAPFARANPGSLLGLYALKVYASMDMKLDTTVVKQIMPLFNNLSAAVRESGAGKSFGERLTGIDRTRIGQEALDFSQNDTAGKSIRLSSFRGKYVLVDFWASWCGPCLLQSPYLVNAYTKFHPKGFEIIGVSLDKKEDKEKWLGAIHFNHLAWTQVSDLNYFQNAVAKEYGINFIPQNFLIDPQGKIVARDLNNDDLENKLKEIYKD